VLRDQTEQYAAAWSEFERLTRVAPHRVEWSRWTAGRGPHTLLMSFVRDPVVVSSICQVQRALAGVEGVELHAPHFFHVSLQTCGFSNELPLDLDELSRAVAAVPRFVVVLGGVNAFHSAMFLETHSGGGLLRLRHALRNALGPRLARIDPFRDFLFHLTIGYLGAEAPIEALRERLRPLRMRECDTARFVVERVALVQLPTDQREPFPVLDCVASFDLGT
jgi:2'-5' RNA ligase